MANITIGEKSYQISPLKLKQVREISNILQARMKNPDWNKDQSPFVEIETWLPFLLQSLKVHNPDVTQEVLEDMTLTEFTEAWNVVVNESGIKLATGERRPRGSTGDLSMDDSAQPSAGTTESLTNIH